MRFWDNDILELDDFFTKIPLPTVPIKLNECAVITDLKTFIENNLATVKRNNGNTTYLPHLNRLKELKEILTSKAN